MSNEIKIAPYGTWKSPITPESLTESITQITTVFVDPVTKNLYYLESRPSEGGRQVLVQLNENGEKDLFGKEWNARTRIHEYGGVPAVIHNGVVYFSNVEDGRVCMFKIGSAEGPKAITPDNSNYRYAELSVVPHHPDIILAVLEDHTKPEPANVVNRLVAINTNTQTIQTIVEGADFYSDPKLSPDGTKLAWLQWFHPDMPWTGTSLMLASFSIASDNTVNITNQVHVAGKSRKISIQQPNWLANDSDHLLFLSDETGYINPWTYTVSSGKTTLNTPDQKTISQDFLTMPTWVLGNSDYAVLSSSLVVHSSVQDNRSVFSVWDLTKKTVVFITTPYSHIESVKVLSETELVFIGRKEDDSAAIVKLIVSVSVGAGGSVDHDVEPKYEVLKSTSTGRFSKELISKPQTFTFPVPSVNGNNNLIHAIYYPAHNPGFKPIEGELPPVLVVLHGGPTGRFPIILDWGIQFWTSRGWAVLDVVYGGSSGFGRKYIDRLEGKWGIVDVDDTISAIRHFAQQGIIDAKRVAVRGRSSSGLTGLAALIKEPHLIGAATSSYGVSDLLKLEEFTHKFESHYLQYLIGGESSESSHLREVYIQRSPITHAEKIKTPLLIIQGLDDAVVPPSQSELIVQKVRDAGGTVKYITFEGEGHGWRKAETIRAVLQAELDWYNEVFKL